MSLEILWFISNWMWVFHTHCLRTLLSWKPIYEPFCNLVSGNMRNLIPTLIQTLTCPEGIFPDIPIQYFNMFCMLKTTIWFQEKMWTCCESGNRNDKTLPEDSALLKKKWLCAIFCAPLSWSFFANIPCLLNLNLTWPVTGSVPILFFQEVLKSGHDIHCSTTSIAHCHSWDEWADYI